MAIQDRNLTPGTKLRARYKGALHTAEVVETTDGLRYRLADGREFSSPSSAGKAVTGKSCNGWAFWSVDTGEGTAATGPVQSTRTAPEQSSTVRPAPKPQPKAKRGRKATANEPTDEAAEGIGCQECEQTFATTAEATEHFNTAHAQPSEEPEPTE